MNASARTEALWEKSPAQERRANPSVAPLPQEVCSGETGRHRGPVRPHVSDGAGLPTFSDGAGI